MERGGREAKSKGWRDPVEAAFQVWEQSEKDVEWKRPGGAQGAEGIGSLE